MSQKQKILFVDDEENVLHGLKRMLHNMRKEWDMHFVTSGKEALEVLAKEAYDIIVSDMRMPEMDGAELLHRVQESYPNIARIVLSGHSDPNMILRAVGPAHQYLSKPCDSETLKKTVARACSLRYMMSSESLVNLVSGLKELPSLPSSHGQLVAEFENQEPSLAKVAEIITRDPAMTAKVLQLVNTEFFGLATKVASTEEAVQLLGIETMRSLVLGIDLFSEMSTVGFGDFSIDRLWTHSFITAVFAKQICLVEGHGMEVADEAFTAGMLHDLGLLVLALNLPNDLVQIWQELDKKKENITDIESNIVGNTHASIGAYLLGLWGLPDTILEAVAYHHTPKDCVEKSFLPLTAVHIADHFAQQHDLSPLPAGIETGFDEEYLKSLKLLDHYEDWKLLCHVTQEEKLYENLGTVIR